MPSPGSDEKKAKEKAADKTGDSKPSLEEVDAFIAKDYLSASCCPRSQDCSNKNFSRPE